MAKVYVSSTIDDLREERKQVFEWLETARHQPVHSYLSDSETVNDSCLADVATCDLLVLILGHRYGFTDDSTSASISQREFREAGKLKIPRVVLLRNYVPDVALSDIESPDKLQAVLDFRAEARRTTRVSEFKQPEELVRYLSAGVEAELKKLQPAPRRELSHWLDAHLTDLRQRFTARLASAHAGTGAAPVYLDLLVNERVAAGDGEAPSDESKAAPALPLEVELLRAQGPLLLIGEGGAGKSTSILHAAVRAADRFESDATNALPVHVDLAPLRKCETLTDLQQFIADSLPRLTNWQQLNELGLLESYRILFLFDSFNEMPEPLQRPCASFLLQLANKHKARHVVLIGSRAVAQLELFMRRDSGFKTLEILRLTAEQVRHFLEGAQLGALYDNMSSSLRELAGNPFALLAIAQTFAGTPKDALPRNRGSLYQKFVARWMQNEERKGRTLDYAYEQVKQHLLAYLAKRMTAAASTALERAPEVEVALTSHLEAIFAREKRRRRMPDPWTLDGFLDEVLGDGLLRRQGDRFYFLHQSVQEYFTSVYFLEEEPAALVEFTPPLAGTSQGHGLAQVSNHRFVAALLMACGVLEDSTAIVAALAERNPVLAGAAIAASNTVKRELVERLTASWIALVKGDENEDAHWLGCSCLAVASLAEEAVVDVLLEASLERGSSAASEALGALGASELVARRLIRHVLPVSELDPAFARRLSSLMVQLEGEKLVEVAFEQWRSETDDATKHRLQRLLASVDLEERVGALERIGKVSKEQSVRDAAQRALLESSTWPALRMVRFGNSRTAFLLGLPDAVHALRTADNDGLARALRSQDAIERTAAATVAGERQAPLAKELLTAIVTFGRGAAPSIVPSLLAVTSSSNAVAMLARTIALGPRVVMMETDVLDALNRGDSATAIKACQARLGLPRSPRLVLDEVPVTSGAVTSWRLRNPFNGPGEFWYEYRLTTGGLELHDYRAAELATRALSEIDGDEASTALREFALTHPQVRVRALALKELGKRRDESVVVPLLAELALTTSEPVARAALGGLAGHRNDAVLSLWTELLSVREQEDAEVHPRWGTCSVAAGWGQLIHDALSGVLDDESLPNRVDSALTADDPNVRSNALRELSRLVEGSDEQRAASWLTDERTAKLADLAIFDVSDRARLAAATLLANNPSEAATKRLSSALHASAFEEKIAAAEAMSHWQFQALHPQVMKEMLDLAREPGGRPFLDRIGRLLVDIPGATDKVYGPIRAQLELNRAEQALALIAAATALFPKDANLYWWRGHALKHLGDLEQAAASFVKASQLFDGPSLIPMALAEVLLQMNDVPGALSVAEDGAESMPDDADAQAVLAWAAWRAGDFARARGAATRAADLDPVHARAIYLVALTAVHGGTLLEARAAVEHARKVWRHLLPDLDMGSLDELVKELDKLTGLEPERAELATELRLALVAGKAA